MVEYILQCFLRLFISFLRTTQYDTIFTVTLCLVTTNTQWAISRLKFNITTKKG